MEADLFINSSIHFYYRLLSNVYFIEQCIFYFTNLSNLTILKGIFGNLWWDELKKDLWKHETTPAISNCSEVGKF